MEDGLFFDFFHDRGHRHLPAGEYGCLPDTRRDTGPAAVTAVSVQVNAGLVHAERSLLARGRARTAADTPLGVEQDLRPEILALRVMTEEAPEGTSFEKHGGAQAGSVVDGEPLDVENGPGQQSRTSCAWFALCIPRMPALTDAIFYRCCL
jgi:hypothetical protein